MSIEEEIKELLKSMDREQLCRFAWLCGVRVLPFLSEQRGFTYWHENDKQKHLYNIFNVLDTATTDSDYICSNANYVCSNFDCANSSVIETIVSVAYVINAAKVAYAAKAVNAAYAANADYATTVAITAVATNAVKVAKKYSFDFDKILLEDIKAIKENRLDKCNHDIDIYGELWDNFQEDLKAIGCDYWAKLYENLFKENFDKINKDDFKGELKRRLSISEEIKDKGAAAVGLYLLSLIKTTPEEEEKKQKKILSKLKTIYEDENKDWTLVLGAGVSIASKVPSWDELIKKLLIKMINEKFKNKNEPYTNKIIESVYKYDSPLAQMRYIKNSYDRNEYNKIIHSILYENNPQIDTPLLKEITELCNQQKIKRIITYNFDDLLERTLGDKIPYKPINKEDDFPDTKKVNIYHVHGYLPKDSSDYDNDTNVVFSEEDYHKIYSDVYHWSNIIQLNCFRENTCLFIGCSLNDPNLRRLLDTVKRNTKGLRHYAIEKKRTFEQHEIVNFMDKHIHEKSYEELGVNVIWVDDYNDYPKKLLEILNPANPARPHALNYAGEQPQDG